jgi:hypothetical protein
MSAERPPLATRTRTLVGTGVLAAVMLVVVCALALARKEVERRKRARTLALLQSLIPAAREWGDRHYNSPGLTLATSRLGFAVYGIDSMGAYDPGTVTFQLDAWGAPIHFRAQPGPVHKHGWDLWSDGPNGIDEQGRGDDILLGEDLEFGANHR